MKIKNLLNGYQVIIKFYGICVNEDSKFRFVEKGVLKRFESFVFLYLIAIVIKNGMNILGVSLPEKM